MLQLYQLQRLFVSTRHALWYGQPRCMCVWMIRQWLNAKCVNNLLCVWPSPHLAQVGGCSVLTMQVVGIPVGTEVTVRFNCDLDVFPGMDGRR